MEQSNIKLMSEIDKELFSQSWSHYRHLEDQRQKNIVFFYTFLTALAGAGLLVLDKKGNQNADYIMTAFYIISLVLTAFGSCVYISISKLQASRSAHGRIIIEILNRYYGETFSESFKVPFFEQLKRSTPTLTGRILPRLLWLQGKASSDRRLTVSLAPMFIWLPLVALLLSALVAEIFLLERPSAAHNIIRLGCIVLDAVITLAITPGVFYAQDSFPISQFGRKNSDRGMIST